MTVAVLLQSRPLSIPRIAENIPAIVMRKTKREKDPLGRGREVKVSGTKRQSLWEEPRADSMLCWKKSCIW
jgi:hypothetical protein